MDPNQLLTELLALAEELLDNESPDPVSITDCAVKVLDLHEWITKGGFLPTLWEKSPQGSPPSADYEAREERRQLGVSAL